MLDDLVKFCSHCGHSVNKTIPEGDNRERHVCPQCHTIHYQNPKIVTGCIPVWEDRILLCRRAIEPRKGLWTLPAGFMENGETLAEGAARETWEEAVAPLKNQTLYATYSLPRISQVYIMYRAELTAEDAFGVGQESLETELFLEEDIPWQEIAFRIVILTLERYLKERVTGQFTIVDQVIA
ncbi:MAG: NUDIX hydrolase [Pseudomonadota bacterium]